MKLDGDYYTMDSGRRFYANHGILGVGVYFDECEDGRPEITISEGYDGGVDTRTFTPEERKELAAYAVALWQRFAEGK